MALFDCPWAICESTSRSRGVSLCIEDSRRRARLVMSASRTRASITERPAVTSRSSVGELLEIADPFLEEIRESVGAVLEELEGIGLVGVL